MREEHSNWFAKWEEELPSPDELISLSQTLITPDLAMAFDIQNPTGNHHHRRLLLQQPPPTPPPRQAQNSPSSQPNSPGEFESSEFGGTLGGGGTGGGAGGTTSGGDEPARTLKRPRLVWTPQLHKRFVDAVAHLGIKNAVPKTIMQLMSVDGLTRENVASHLQKYRLYLKRMQGISNGSGGGGSGGAGGGGGSDTDHLFASSPVPAHFLHPGRANPDHFLPFVPVNALQHHHQMAAVVGNHHHHHQQQLQQQQFRHFGTSPPNGQFENPFLSRQSQSMRTPLQNSYAEDMDSAKTTANGRTVLTLFPTAED